MTNITNVRPVTVLIHGFLDDNTLWDGVRADLEREGLTVVTPRMSNWGPIFAGTALQPSLEIVPRADTSATGPKSEQ